MTDSNNDSTLKPGAAELPATPTSKTAGLEPQRADRQLGIAGIGPGIARKLSSLMTSYGRQKGANREALIVMRGM